MEIKIFIFSFYQISPMLRLFINSYVNALSKNTFLISSKLQLKSLICLKMYINCLSLQFSKFLKMASSREAMET